MRSSKINGSLRLAKFDKLNPETSSEQINNNMNYQSAMNAQKPDQTMQATMDLDQPMLASIPTNNHHMNIDPKTENDYMQASPDPFKHPLLDDTQQSAFGIGNLLNNNMHSSKPVQSSLLRPYEIIPNKGMP